MLANACGLNKVMCDDSGGKYRKFAEQTYEI